MLQDTCNTTTTGGPNCTVSSYFRVSQQEVSQNPDYTSILTVRRHKCLLWTCLLLCSCLTLAACICIAVIVLENRSGRCDCMYIANIHGSVKHSCCAAATCR